MDKIKTAQCAKKGMINIDNNIENYNEEIFEKIKRINEYGQEYWSARDLSKVLEYKDYRNFLVPVDKAMEACKKSGFEISLHFGEATYMLPRGNNAHRTVDTYYLTRYACYLIVQNADPSKKVVALGQTYFAIKTRQQELIDDYDTLSEEQKRLAIRKEMISHNKSLAYAAHNAGVIEPIDYAIFQNCGYQGLYGGLGRKEIHQLKGLKKSHDILDYMGSTELAANLFRATQTEEKLRKENIKGKSKANTIHFEVGAKVRKTMLEISGTAPEDLPTPVKSIKQIEKEHKKLPNDI